MKICIVGCGYLGTALAHTLSTHHEVQITSRDKPEIDGIRAIIHDTQSEASWKKILDSCDIVIITIGSVIPSWLHLPKTCAHIIYTSTCSVYAENQGGTVDESTTNLTPSEHLKIEKTLQALSPKVSIVRLGEIYGPLRDPASRVTKPLPGDGSNITNLIHVADIAGIIEFIIKNNLYGVFNACNDTHITRNQLYTTICKSYCVDPPIWNGSPTTHGSKKIVSNRKIKSLGYQFIHSEYTPPLQVAFSPCPNDTFIFQGWAEDAIIASAMLPVLEDVQTLNEKALIGTYPVTKISFATYNLVKDNYIMLPVGAALARNAGPKIVAKKKFSLSDLATKRLAIPGKLTTANLLLNHFFPSLGEKIYTTYDQTLTLLKNDLVDACLIIHEQRFTFEEEGFVEIVDLGDLWEEKYDLPLPLGCIVAKKSLGAEAILKITQAIKDSLLWKKKHLTRTAFIKKHAQVKELKVIQKHIDLYVSKETFEQSEEAKRAIDVLLSTNDLIN